MSKFRHILFIFFLLLLNVSQTLCHTRGLRPRKSSWKHPITNETTAQFSEMQFMKWVKFVGSLKHSLFRTAKNKLFPSHTITVAKNPAAGHFTKIQDAIDSLPFINLVRVVIKVHAGVYMEKVSIPPLKSYITIEGAGADKTIVQWGDTAQTPGSNGKPIGTYSSATFAVNSPYFIAKNITFKNTTPVPAPGAVGKQAVAFRISADTASFWGCKFLGAQDTLYDQLGRHYYKDCYIEGSVDFIFGNGLSLFEGCHVHAIAQYTGALTAQGRSSLLEDTGFSFVKCKVTGSGALYLGRAWGPFSRVVFAYTYMDNIIMPKGWYNWGDPNREMVLGICHHTLFSRSTKSAFLLSKVGRLNLGSLTHEFIICLLRFRPFFLLQNLRVIYGDADEGFCIDAVGFLFLGSRTVFYGQYKCTGPGANFAGRVSWSRQLTDEEAKPFISLSYIDGSEWIKL